MSDKLSCSIHSEFPYPCYCCIYNERTTEDEPCATCEHNVGACPDGNKFEPIIEIGRKP